MNERIARAALTRLFEPGDRVGLALVAAHGAEDALHIATSGKPASASGGFAADELKVAQDAWAARIPLLTPVEHLAEIAKLDGGFLIPGDEHWPTALNDLPEAPLGLWYRGDIAAGIPSPNGTVAVTGSRDATSYGASVTGELGYGMAQRGSCIVSGLAYGIETHAHRAALAGHQGVGPATIAVLAGGLDRDYPSGNADLAEHIRERGLMISELPPVSAPTRRRFLARNRLMAALAGVTCIVESRSRSTALVTAQVAGDLGRQVAAVPGSVFSANSAGCHKLIKDGTAALVTDATSIANLLFTFSRQKTDLTEDQLGDCLETSKDS